MDQKNGIYSGVWKAANVVFPLCVYLVAMNVAFHIVAAVVVGAGGEQEEQYMMIQTIAALMTFPVIWYYHRKDRTEPTTCQMHLAQVLHQKSRGRQTANGILMFLAGASGGIALNNVISMTALEKVSRGYQEVTQYFFAGGILFELIGAVLVTPLLEEMLYRSVIYGRICDLLAPSGKSCRYAIFLTALIFGAMHGNLVQFLYAFLLGMMFSWFVEEAGHFYGAVAAHMGANLMAVLRADTGLFQWMTRSEGAFLGATGACLVLTLVLLAVLWKCNSGQMGAKRR